MGFYFFETEGSLDYVFINKRNKEVHKLERAINKIYGKSVKTESVAVADYNSNATINEAYKINSFGRSYIVGEHKHRAEQHAARENVGEEEFHVVNVSARSYNATINEAYKIKDDGNYLVKSTGKGGFENGTVTCWVVVVETEGSLDYVFINKRNKEVHKHDYERRNFEPCEISQVLKTER